MPKSVKTIIDKMLYKGAMTQKEHDKVMRKLQDIPAIVHCKECYRRATHECPMYYEEEVSWDEDGFTEIDFIPHDNTSDEGFCHLGER